MNTLIRYCLVVQVTLVAVALSAIVALLSIFNTNIGLTVLSEAGQAGEKFLIVGTLFLVGVGEAVVVLFVWYLWNRARLFLLTP